MDRIDKALEKLSPKEREQIKHILIQLAAGSFTNFDIKKLKGRDDIFRIRKGKLRIVFRKDKKRGVFILAIERRKEMTYKPDRF